MANGFQQKGSKKEQQGVSWKAGASSVALFRSLALLKMLGGCLWN
jgi:hypothetical protein